MLSLVITCVFDLDDVGFVLVLLHIGLDFLGFLLFAVAWVLALFICYWLHTVCCVYLVIWFTYSYFLFLCFVNLWISCLCTCGLLRSLFGVIWVTQFCLLILCLICVVCWLLVCCFWKDVAVDLGGWWVILVCLVFMIVYVVRWLLVHFAGLMLIVACFGLVCCN